MVSNEFDPFLSVLCGRCLEVEVSRGREEPEEVRALVFGVFEVGDGGEVGEVNLVAEAVFFLVAVDGEGVWAEDEEDGLPVLQAEERLVSVCAE